MRQVTEQDFRLPEFRDANPDDYEFRDGDNKVVRKDRWRTGIMQIACACGFSTREGFEIHDVVQYVEGLHKDADSWTDVEDELPRENCTVDFQIADGSMLTRGYFRKGTFRKYAMIFAGVTKWREHKLKDAE